QPPRWPPGSISKSRARSWILPPCIGVLPLAQRTFSAVPRKDAPQVAAPVARAAIALVRVREQRQQGCEQRKSDHRRQCGAKGIAAANRMADGERAAGDQAHCAQGKGKRHETAQGVATRSRLSRNLHGLFLRSIKNAVRVASPCMSSRNRR